MFFVLVSIIVIFYFIFFPYNSMHTKIIRWKRPSHQPSFAITQVNGTYQILRLPPAATACWCGVVARSCVYVCVRVCFFQARDEALLSAAKEKLEAAIASYVPTKASWFFLSLFFFSCLLVATSSCAHSRSGKTLWGRRSLLGIQGDCCYTIETVMLCTWTIIWSGSMRPQKKKNENFVLVWFSISERFFQVLECWNSACWECWVLFFSEECWIGFDFLGEK